MDKFKKKKIQKGPFVISTFLNSTLDIKATDTMVTEDNYEVEEDNYNDEFEFDEDENGEAKEAADFIDDDDGFGLEFYTSAEAVGKIEDLLQFKESAAYAEELK
jgi:hypothetical protein